MCQAHATTDDPPTRGGGTRMRRMQTRNKARKAESPDHVTTSSKSAENTMQQGQKLQPHRAPQNDAITTASNNRCGQRP